jgi:hypothetical protein
LTIGFGAHPAFMASCSKLGFAVAQSTVAKYMAKNGEPSGQSWGTFHSRKAEMATGHARDTHLVCSL